MSTRAAVQAEAVAAMTTVPITEASETAFPVTAEQEQTQNGNT